MIAETLAPGASVSKVAQRYGVNANLLFTWRRPRQGADGDRAGVGVVPAMQGFLRQVGKCSVAAIYSVFGATSLLTLMRYADWRPITLAGFLSPIDPAG